MKILGVDPGLRVTGYGVIRVSEGYPRAGHIELLEAGVIRTKADSGIASRLGRVYGALSEIILEFKPQLLAIEKLYAHYKHPATAILMGHVRGAVCLLSATHDVPLANIASTHVKKAVTGRGHAGKEQIQRMVQHTLDLREAPGSSDAADALALAIACARNYKKVVSSQ